jgi:hypothetical protein
MVSAESLFSIQLFWMFQRSNRWQSCQIAIEPLKTDRRGRGVPIEECGRRWNQESLGWFSLIAHEVKCMAEHYYLERNGEIMKLGWHQRVDSQRSHPGKYLEPQIELSERRLQPSCKTLTVECESVNQWIRNGRYERQKNGDSEFIWEMRNGHPKLSCLNQLKKLSTVFL